MLRRTPLRAKRPTPRRVGAPAPRIHQPTQDETMTKCLVYYRQANRDWRAARKLAVSA